MLPITLFGFLLWRESRQSNLDVVQVIRHFPIRSKGYGSTETLNQEQWTAQRYSATQERRMQSADPLAT